MFRPPAVAKRTNTVAFIAINDDSYKLQSLIITVNRTKNKKILGFRWGKSGEMEVECEGGKWSKQEAGPEINKIVDMVKAVVQNSPRDAKEPVDFTLPKELEQNVNSILDGLETSTLQCIRTGS